MRDQALFVGSLLAAELEPRLRQAAGASSWQVNVLTVWLWVLGGGVLEVPDGCAGGWVLD